MFPTNQTQIKNSTLLILAALFSRQAVAGLPEKAYIAQLKAANLWVSKKKAESAPRDQALSSQLLTRLYGRYYEVGDTWTVAAWQLEHGMMRMTGDLNRTQSQVGRGGIFKYLVTDVKTGSQPQVVIQITQVEAWGIKPVDPNVQFLELKMNDSLLQSEKTYRVGTGPNSQLRVASANGIHTEISALELYPLDAPEVSFSNQVPTKAPVLPKGVEAFATQTGLQLNFANSFQFQQDDFFGRPVSVIWESGKPWPSYLKTQNGIALLLDGSNL